MSRRAAEPGEVKEVEWVQADLISGQGLAEAVSGTDVILHTASNPVKSQVDVEGTRLLLQEGEAAGIKHFLYISIVGIEDIGFSYYQNKLAAEQLIKDSGLPWTIQRATQFHSFIDRLLGAMTRLPVALVPTNWQFQAISDGEAAEYLVAAVRQGPSGRLPDIGGPEIQTMGDMARQWLAVQGKRKPILPIPAPGKLSAGFRQGLNTTPANRIGIITWAKWLEARYGSRSDESAVSHETNNESEVSA
jgi:uncharacterized protein YbjT (DUF2867 family)